MYFLYGLSYVPVGSVRRLETRFTASSSQTW